MASPAPHHECEPCGISRQQGGLAEQALCGLWQAHELAAQLGQELGRGQVLLGALSPCAAQGRLIDRVTIQENTMPLFQKLPGFQRAAPGLEQRIWRRLPGLLFWGTALPLLTWLGLWLATGTGVGGAAERALGVWMYGLLGFIMLHWSLWIALALGCFIVRVMKGPAYVADAYPLPEGSGLRPQD